MSGKGTGHHRLHGITGLITIISLPFALFGLMGAIPGKAEGIKAWVGSPFGAVSLFIFLTAALWYVKLEFDQVIQDYASGKFRKAALLANAVFEIILWLVAAFVIYSMWRGA